MSAAGESPAAAAIGAQFNNATVGGNVYVTSSFDKSVILALKSIPNFFLTLSRIVFLPLEWSRDVVRGEVSFSDALTFFLISIIFTEILMLPILRPSADLVRFALSDACWKFIVVAGFWMLLAGSLSLLAKNPAHLKNATLSLYYFGVLNILTQIILLIFWSMLQESPTCREGDTWCHFGQGPSPWLSMAIFGLLALSPVAILFWCGACWWTYAAVNGISIARLAAVSFLVGLVGLPFASLGLWLRALVLENF